MGASKDDYHNNTLPFSNSKSLRNCFDLSSTHDARLYKAHNTGQTNSRIGTYCPCIPTLGCLEGEPLTTDKSILFLDMIELEQWQRVIPSVMSSTFSAVPYLRIFNNNNSKRSLLPSYIHAAHRFFSQINIHVHSLQFLLHTYSPRT